MVNAEDAGHVLSLQTDFDVGERHSYRSRVAHRGAAPCETHPFAEPTGAERNRLIGAELHMNAAASVGRDFFVDVATGGIEEIGRERPRAKIVLCP